MPDPEKSGYIKMVSLDEAKEMRRQEKARQRQQDDDDDDEEDDDFEVNEEGLVKVDDLERGSGYIKMVTLEEAKEMRRKARGGARVQEKDDDLSDDDDDDDDDFDVDEDGFVKVPDPERGSAT